MKISWGYFDPFRVTWCFTAGISVLFSNMSAFSWQHGVIFPSLKLSTCFLVTYGCGSYNIIYVIIAIYAVSARQFLLKPAITHSITKCWRIILVIGNGGRIHYIICQPAYCARTSGSYVVYTHVRVQKYWWFFNLVGELYPNRHYFCVYTAYYTVARSRDHLECESSCNSLLGVSVEWGSNH